MATLSELFQQAQRDPNIVGTPEWQSSLKSWMGDVEKVNPLETNASTPMAKSMAPLSGDALLLSQGKHPLQPILADPNFKQWFQSSYPEVEYPPARNQMADYIHTYEQSTGQKVPEVMFSGLSFRPGQAADPTQARDFMNGMREAYGGNPPFDVKPKNKKFIFHIGSTARKLIPFLGSAAGATAGGLTAGPYGALIGAGIGGGLGSLAGGTGGSSSSGTSGLGEGVNKVSLLSPEEERLKKFALTKAMGGLSVTPDIEDATRRFRSQYMPSLFEGMERMGGGQQESSALAPAMATAEAQYRTGLEQLKNQQAMQLANIGMGRSAFENVAVPRQPGVLEQIIPSAAGAATKAIMGKLF